MDPNRTLTNNHEDLATETCNFSISPGKIILGRDSEVFLAVGNEFDLIEGVWPGQIVVVHEWPDREAFNAWYASDVYRPWKEIRQAASSANVVLIDGLPAETAEDAD